MFGINSVNEKVYARDFMAFDQISHKKCFTNRQNYISNDWQLVLISIYYVLLLFMYYLSLRNLMKFVNEKGLISPTSFFFPKEIGY